MYYLLPFNFIVIDNQDVLINELGDLLVTPQGTAESLITHRLEERTDIYKSLVSNYFITERPIPSTFDVYAERLAEKKRFLDDKTSLHLFVITLRCNQHCSYCQASSIDGSNTHVTMTKHCMGKAVDLMFESPSGHLTMEFQGGEPSLEPDLLKYGIEYALQKNEVEKRRLTFVLCTNCIDISNDVISLCKQYDVLISTSLDGPEWLHNANRGKNDSYQKVKKGISMVRDILGHDKVSALMTTSELSLQYPREIIDEYVNLGFHDIFLRSLNPYGLAKDNKNWGEYTQKFISFYKEALDYIIELNKNGLFIRENFATIILRKILTPWNSGFVDLQSPAGIVNSVIAYNYDGNVYASDESRMLIEHGDSTFRLGNIDDDYDSLFFSRKTKHWAEVWNNETLAGCSSCPFKVYCGADPVRNHSTQSDMYGFRPTSLFCKKNSSIIHHLIRLIVTRRSEVIPIFMSWIR